MGSVPVLKIQTEPKLKSLKPNRNWNLLNRTETEGISRNAKPNQTDPSQTYKKAKESKRGKSSQIQVKSSLLDLTWLKNCWMWLDWTWLVTVKTSNFPSSVRNILIKHWSMGSVRIFFEPNRTETEVGSKSCEPNRSHHW